MTLLAGSVRPRSVSDELKADWQLLMQLRDSALGQLDELKKQAGLNKASESLVTYHLPAEMFSSGLPKLGCGSGGRRWRGAF